MFGYAALSVAQFGQIASLIEEWSDYNIVGLVLSNPSGQAVSVSLMGDSGEALVEETILPSKSDPAFAQAEKEDVQFVPAIMSFDPKNVEWVVNNYLDADDIRFTGSFAECEAFLGKLNQAA